MGVTCPHNLEAVGVPPRPLTLDCKCRSLLFLFCFFLHVNLGLFPKIVGRIWGFWFCLGVICPPPPQLQSSSRVPVATLTVVCVCTGTEAMVAGSHSVTWFAVLCFLAVVLSLALISRKPQNRYVTTYLRGDRSHLRRIVHVKWQIMAIVIQNFNLHNRSLGRQ